MKKVLQVFPDSEQLLHATVQFIIDCADEAIAARGAFHLALAGGGTPRAFHALLAQPASAGRIDWDRVHIYFGDERVVPHDHPDSNYRMARTTLLDHIPIPAANIHPVPIHVDDPQAGAREYAQTLQALLPADRHQRPVFDLILLGLGRDGHTASLFPDTAILSIRDRSVAAVHVPQLDCWRISLTYPTLDAARRLLLVASGEEKADIIAAVHAQESAPYRYPVQGIRPDGTLYWFVDATAGSKLKQHQPQG